MAKKFAEHSGLNLTEVNKDVLADWEKNDVFHKSISEREGCPSSFSSKVLLLPMVIPVFTMCLPVLLRIRSTDIRQ